jgi:hypothetical protein
MRSKKRPLNVVIVGNSRFHKANFCNFRLCFTSVILAMKFNEDSCFSNTYNAMVSGVDKDELMLLELSFLKLIDFRLHVSPETFQSYYNHLSETSERRALLSNCSCLDPTHSYKVSHEMLKNGSKIHRNVHDTSDSSPKNYFDKQASTSENEQTDPFLYEADQKDSAYYDEKKGLDEEVRMSYDQSESDKVPTVFKSHSTSTPHHNEMMTLPQVGYTDDAKSTRASGRVGVSKNAHNLGSCKYAPYNHHHRAYRNEHRISF